MAIACDAGAGTSRFHRLFIGDRDSGNGIDWDLPGIGLQFVNISTSQSLEFLNGNESQVLANDGDTQSTAPTYAGRAMLMYGISDSQIPGYRGYLSAFLFDESGGVISGWPTSYTGEKSYAFEVSSYHTSHAQLATYGRIGLDINPVNAIYLLLAQKFGALGIDASKIGTIDRKGGPKQVT